MKATTNGNPLAQKISKQLDTLPEESLVKLADYIEYLRFNARKTVRKPANKRDPKRQLTIVRLEGLLEGYEFSPEMIAEARREMWKSLDDYKL